MGNYDDSMASHDKVDLTGPILKRFDVLAVMREAENDELENTATNPYKERYLDIIKHFHQR